MTSPTALQLRQPAPMTLAATVLWLAANTASVSAAEGWSRLADLPAREGLAGAFAGESGGAWIVGGGANFPGKKPWEGGKKVWHDAVYALDQPEGQWRVAGRLPRPLGYGVSASYRDAVVVVGGSDANRHYADAFRLTWKDGKLTTSPLPALPRPMANGCGALVAPASLLVGGGQESPDDATASPRFWSLDLSDQNANWTELPKFPGRPRILPTAAVLDAAFYLFGGAELVADAAGKPQRRYLRDAWSFRAKQGWQRLADLPAPSAAAPSPAPVDQRGIYLLGGDDGAQLPAAPEAHRGFSKNILRYDPSSNQWTKIGEMPVARVTVPCVPFRQVWLIPSGEVRPGVRSPEVWKFRPGEEAKR